MGVGERVADMMCREERRKEARKWVLEEGEFQYVESWWRSFSTRGGEVDIEMGWES